MKSYLKFIAKSFQKQAAYRVEYLVGLINGFLYVFIFTSLWNALYSASDSSIPGGSFTRGSIISYAVFAMVIKISFAMDDQTTTRKIRTGALVTDLIKPLNYFYLTLSECIGQSLFHLLARGLPTLALGLMFFNINMPVRIENYILLFITGVLGYSILFMINYLFGLLAFWFIETFSFQLVKYALYTIFSGAIVPIEFFPGWTQTIIGFLPFEYILYVPTSVFMGRFDQGTMRLAITGQIVWAVMLWLISRLAWNRAMKRLVIQGG